MELGAVPRLGLVECTVPLALTNAVHTHTHTHTHTHITLILDTSFSPYTHILVERDTCSSSGVPKVGVGTPKYFAGVPR